MKQAAGDGGQLEAMRIVECAAPALQSTVLLGIPAKGFARHYTPSRADYCGGSVTGQTVQLGLNHCASLMRFKSLRMLRQVSRRLSKLSAEP